MDAIMEQSMQIILSPCAIVEMRKAKYLTNMAGIAINLTAKSAKISEIEKWKVLQQK